MSHLACSQNIRMSPANRAVRHIAAIAVPILSLMSLSCGAGDSPPSTNVRPNSVVAYSLRVAENLLRSSGRREPTDVALAGITELLGVVRDKKSGDLILLGREGAGGREITLDDFAVALRAVLVKRIWPLVSIDATTETKTTGQQKVRFEGDVEDTQLGLDMLDADIKLKRIALALAETDVPGVQSYLKLSVQSAEAGSSTDSVATRFWFVPALWDFAGLKGSDVLVTRKLDIAIRSEILGRGDSSYRARQGDLVEDEAGTAFSTMLTATYSEVASRHAEMGRLRSMFSVATTACGTGRVLSPSSSTKTAADQAATPSSEEREVDCGDSQALQARELQYWLNDYSVAKVPTPREYAVRRNSAKVRIGDVETNMMLEGGVALQALKSRLHSGSPGAVKELVLSLRPNADTPYWRVPLDDWTPGSTAVQKRSATSSSSPAPSSSAMPTESDAELERRIGFSVTRQIDLPGIQPAAVQMPRDLPPLNSGFPRFSVRESLPPVQVPRTGPEPRVGGVKLNQTAKIDQLDDLRIEGVNWNAEHQRLDLTVRGEVVSLTGAYMEDFAAVVESVYGGDDPGVSIDPGPIRNVSDVRYIGKVRNTRLGWVMFEADRILKGYTMGEDNLTGQPMSMDLPGFHTVMDLMKGQSHPAGISMRFWFVPGEIRAKRAGDALVFENSDKIPIRVETEYLNPGLRGQADPFARQFADYVTEHYDDFAKKHPVLKDLREYAKMVAIAKYLKERGVPLTWFALAHRNERGARSTPEQTPSFKVNVWWGGVNLDARATTVNAWAGVHELLGPSITANDGNAPPSVSAGSQQPSTDVPRAMAFVPTVQFSYADTTFTTLQMPATVTTAAGRDLTFQTDAAIVGRAPVVELVRYYDKSHRQDGEFGRGWRLLKPYSLGISQQTREFQGVEVPDHVTIIDPMADTSAQFQFGTDSAGLVGYFPDRPHTIRGVYLLSDRSYKARDIWGNTYMFDREGNLTVVDMGTDNRWAYSYAGNRVTGIWPLPSRLNAKQLDDKVPLKDSDMVKVAGVLVPKEIEIVDRAGTEVLGFVSDAQGLVSHVAPRPKRWARIKGLAPRVFRLEDVCGNQVTLRWPGDLVDVTIKGECKTGAGADYPRVEFKYDHAGRVLLASLGSEGRVAYQYDDPGNLEATIGLDGTITRYSYSSDGAVTVIRNRSLPMESPSVWNQRRITYVIAAFLALAGVLAGGLWWKLRSGRLRAADVG